MIIPGNFRSFYQRFNSVMQDFNELHNTWKLIDELERGEIEKMYEKCIIYLNAILLLSCLQ